MIDQNQKPKSTGELLNQLTKSRPPQKIWVAGEQVEVKKTDHTPVKAVAVQTKDLSHLPAAEKMTATRPTPRLWFHGEQLTQAEIDKRIKESMEIPVSTATATNVHGKGLGRSSGGF